ncbi:Sds3p [Sugiyamaella lignohabitans]|uniref:Sds3p n=1 Tax=Sugiyamaella lignohabitans TaxID=796027 RepID=A0A167F0A0_9ASCO|nr:Sds3p [Sugiyamaella lignohabitans]ANB14664.1 Sds3p [Sugiyamaella lignohabitans]
MDGTGRMAYAGDIHDQTGYGGGVVHGQYTHGQISGYGPGSAAAASVMAGGIGGVGVGVSGGIGAGGVGTGTGAGAGGGGAQPASKRDKRRQTLAAKLDQITDMFENERDFHYSEMLRTLQSTLYSLHVGDNPEFLEELTDLEEVRDEQLVMLYLWEKYQIERADHEYNQDVELANEEHRQMTDMVKEKLMAKLESQRRKLSEDKTLLDIANDHSFFLSSSGLYHSERNSAKDVNSDYGGGSSTAGAFLYPPGSPSGRDFRDGGGMSTRAAAGSGSAAAAAIGAGGGGSGGTGYGIGGYGGTGLNGHVNGLGAGGEGFSSQSGMERRALRRRGGAAYDDSGLSGGEGSGGAGGTGTGGATSTRRRGAYHGTLNGSGAANTNGYRTNNGGSDMETAAAFSDRDLEGMLFSKDREAPTTRHSSKAYHGVRVLKPEEAQEDIDLLRASIRRAKRP